MEAIHLPPQILHQQVQAQASTVVPGTPGMTPHIHEPESTWQAVAYEYTCGEMFASHDRNLCMSSSIYVPYDPALTLACSSLAQESRHVAQEISNTGSTDPL